MIQYKRQIDIESSPETVFGLIETMPDKFPVYRVLEARPIYFIRVLLVAGLREAREAAKVERPDDVLILDVGDSMGPFTLTQIERPFRYWFTFESFLFKCRTGYTLSADGDRTTLEFDLIAENPGAMERFWWFFIKPFHGILANKVLRNIKERVESRGR